MKKVLIAVLIIFGLLFVGVAGVGYYLYTKAKPYVGAARSYVTEMGKLAEIDKSVANTASFVAPANGELTEDMVTRFAAVQESMVAKLGPTVQEMKAREDEFQKRQNAEHRQATPAEDFTVVTDLMKFIVQGKNAQVEALNQSRFSLDEYYWVRGRVYAAAGMSIAGLNLRALSDAMTPGAMTKEVAATGEEVPDRNKALVQPYLPRLQDWAVFAFFGL